MLKDNDEFTINIPLYRDLRKELAFCGSKSGRDIDKIKALGLTVKEGRVVQTPIIQECELHYECKVIYRQAMEPNAILHSVQERYYKTNNFHMIYYGEIVDAYQIEGE